MWYTVAIRNGRDLPPEAAKTEGMFLMKKIALVIAMVAVVVVIAVGCRRDSSHVAAWSSTPPLPLPTASMSSVVKATLMYTQDYDDFLPPPDRLEAVEPYLREVGRVGSGYAFPASLAGKKLQLPAGGGAGSPFLYQKEGGEGWVVGLTDGTVTDQPPDHLDKLVFYTR